MTNTSSRLNCLPLGFIALGTLASCSLPPKQAWQQIQSRGLIPYVASEVRGDFDKDRPGSPAATPAAAAPTSAIVQSAPSAPAPKIAAPRSSAASIASATIRSIPPPSQLPTSSLPVAKGVEGLAGYVRSPFTNPPRLVDVRGLDAGSKVVCPYTRKPFLVPAGMKNVSTSENVASADPRPTPAPLPRVADVQPIPQPKLPTSQMVKEAPTQPTNVAANTASAPTPPQNNPTPAPAPSAAAAPKQQAAPAPAPAADEIPFGTAIASRPGFVNSPFAAKHQLVDVTGLPTGMEVKCPYTGKLFRVPPMANGPAKP